MPYVLPLVLGKLHFKLDKEVTTILRKTASGFVFPI